MEPKDDPELREWYEEFEAAARRPFEQRMRYAFIDLEKRSSQYLL